MIKREFDRQIEEFGRQLLISAYNQVTEEQKEVFNRMYKSVDKIPFEKMSWAYEQCLQTIRKNNALKGATKEINEL